VASFETDPTPLDLSRRFAVDAGTRFPTARNPDRVDGNSAYRTLVNFGIDRTRDQAREEGSRPRPVTKAGPWNSHPVTKSGPDIPSVATVRRRALDKAGPEWKHS
jgi:hypothetical protein